MVRNLRSGLRQSLKPSVAGGLGDNDIFTTASLDLNFAKYKNLGTVDATTGQNLVDFTRASSGTYVGSDGLIKTATTNLLLRSEEFGTTWTTLNASVSADQILAPNGTLTADKLLETASTGAHHVTQSVSALTGAYTVSVYIKASEVGHAMILMVGGTTQRGVGFNLSTGATYAEDIGGVSPPDIGASAVNIGDGWWRCRMTWTADGQTVLRIQTDSGTGTGSTTGNGTSGIYIWGAQLEQSSTVGEYVKTTSTINSAPRFDHNPTTGESLGLLVEESRTNLTTFSEDATQWGAGSNMGTTLSNQTTAPDGTSTADKIVENTANSLHFLSQTQTTSYTSGTPYTRTIFLKAAGRRYASVYFPGTNFPSAGRAAVFDLEAGVIINTESGVTSSIDSYQSGWYRCRVTATASSTGTGHVGGSAISDNPSLTSYAGDGSSGVFVWGAQLEEGSFPTSYIPTEGSTVTRAADVASITGTNFSSWYRQDEGTVFAEAVNMASDISPRCLFEFDDGTNNNRATFRARDISTSASTFFCDSGSIRQFAEANMTDYGSNVFSVAACLSSQLGYAVSSTGIILRSGSMSAMPSVNRLGIGAEGNAARFQGHISRLTYWQTRLPNETLQTITQ